MSEYEDIEKKFEEAQELARQQKLEELEKAMPVEERIMRLEQAKAHQESVKRMAELVKDEELPLPSLKERLERLDHNAPMTVKSGFSKLDELTGGFRYANTYLVAGLEKSGKSSYLMDILTNMLQAGIKVGYINTELSDTEFYDRMAAIHCQLPTRTIEQDYSFKEKWAEQFNNNCYYAGISNPDDLSIDGALSFDKSLKRMEEFAFSGAQVFVVDNLTTFQTILDGKKKGWEILGGCIQKIIKFAKEHRVVVFMVIHTKPSVVFGETPSGIRSILNDDPLRIFHESITLTRKPTLTDVYGGGAALSQISGALIVWRPYQKFNEEHLQKEGSIILDSFRHAASGKEIRVEFAGDKSTFYEVEEGEYTGDALPF